MSEVKRFRPGILFKGKWETEAVMSADAFGEYVLHFDYAAVKAERDELAKAIVKGHCWREFFDEHRPDGATHYCTACRGVAWDRNGEGDEDGVFDAHHEPGCPLVLAAEILKESPNER